MALIVPAHWVIERKGTFFGSLRIHFAQNQLHELTEIPVQGRVLISSGLSLSDCALAGMGPALLPHWVIGKDVKRGNLVDVFPDIEVTPTDFNTAAWFVYPSATRLPKKCGCLSTT